MTSLSRSHEIHRSAISQLHSDLLFILVPISLLRTLDYNSKIKVIDLDWKRQDHRVRYPSMFLKLIS